MLLSFISRMFWIVDFDSHRAFQNENKSLRSCITQFATRFELRSVLSKTGFHRGSGMHSRHALLHARQSYPNKGIRRKQYMIRFLRASRVA
jgi:hypothetical protein